MISLFSPGIAKISYFSPGIAMISWLSTGLILTLGWISVLPLGSSWSIWLISWFSLGTAKKQLIINRYNTYPRMDISAGAAARVQTVNLVNQLILTRNSNEQVFCATGRNLKIISIRHKTSEKYLDILVCWHYYIFNLNIKKLFIVL